jgi:hypothetical protein
MVWSSCPVMTRPIRPWATTLLIWESGSAVWVGAAWACIVCTHLPDSVSKMPSDDDA